MKTLIFALLVAALTIAPIASAEWATPAAQATAVKAARLMFKQHGVRYVQVQACRYETKASPPESIPHGYAETWCNLQLVGYEKTPKTLPQWNPKHPTVAGFRYPPGFFAKGAVDMGDIEWVYPTPYQGAEGLDTGGGDSITINGTSYSVPS